MRAANGRTQRVRTKDGRCEKLFLRRGARSRRGAIEWDLSVRDCHVSGHTVVAHQQAPRLRHRTRHFLCWLMVPSVLSRCVRWFLHGIWSSVRSAVQQRRDARRSSRVQLPAELPARSSYILSRLNPNVKAPGPAQLRASVEHGVRGRERGSAGERHAVTDPTTPRAVRRTQTPLRRRALPQASHDITEVLDHILGDYRVFL